MVIKEKLLELLLGVGLNDILSELIVTAIAVVIWIFVGILLIQIMKKITKGIFKNANRSARTVTVTKLMNSVLKYVIWFIIFMVILTELNVNVAPFIASAGVLGLAIGFGAQAIVKDFISGFFIIVEGAFDVGDVVIVDGFKGAVTSLGLRTTTLRNWKGEVKTINNGDIKGLINFSKNTSTAVVEVGVNYNTDLTKLREVMDQFCIQSMEKHELIIETPKFLGITEFADSSINIKLIAKTKTEQHYGVERELRKELVEVFAKENIEIPFPHVVIKNA